MALRDRRAPSAGVGARPNTPSASPWPEVVERLQVGAVGDVALRPARSDGLGPADAVACHGFGRREEEPADVLVGGVTAPSA